MYILRLQSMISFLVKLNSYKPIVKHSTTQSYRQCFNHAVSPKGADIRAKAERWALSINTPSVRSGLSQHCRITANRNPQLTTSQQKLTSWPRYSRPTWPLRQPSPTLQTRGKRCGSHRQTWGSARTLLRVCLGATLFEGESNNAPDSKCLLNSLKMWFLKFKWLNFFLSF